MKKNMFIYMIVSILLLSSCQDSTSPQEIILQTIYSIDTLETIFYKQDMTRSNPRNVEDTIFRYREMYFQRLPADSIVGVKGHWYMYVEDKENVIYEDVYDGNRLIRMNNRDSIARVYDLLKYPDFRKKHFWSHNTPYGMQHEFRYMLGHSDFYTLERLPDTILNNQPCYRIKVVLKNMVSMPGFWIKLEESEGNISETVYYIDKNNFYLLRMKGTSFNVETPDQKMFIDQQYYDIEFNSQVNDHVLFDTSLDAIAGFEVLEMKPD